MNDSQILLRVLGEDEPFVLTLVALLEANTQPEFGIEPDPDLLLARQLEVGEFMRVFPGCTIQRIAYDTGMPEPMGISSFETWAADAITRALDEATAEAPHDEALTLFYGSDLDLVDDIPEEIILHCHDGHEGPWTMTLEEYVEIYCHNDNRAVVALAVGGSVTIDGELGPDYTITRLA